MGTVDKAREKEGDAGYVEGCCSQYHLQKKAHPLMPGDKLTIHRCTALFCSETGNHKRENHRAREKQSGRKEK